MAEAVLSVPTFQPADLLSQENLDRADETVIEIFARMLGISITLSAPPIPAIGEGDERTAIVGYSGAMRGCCEIQMNQGAATAAASAMMGMPVDDTDSLDDAVGEICNMIGGGWKDRVPSLCALCAMSPPTVITGRAYKVHMSRPSIKMTRCYTFEDQYLFLVLRCEETSQT